MLLMKRVVRQAGVADNKPVVVLLLLKDTSSFGDVTVHTRTRNFEDA